MIGQKQAEMLPVQQSDFSRSTQLTNCPSVVLMCLNSNFSLVWQNEQSPRYD